MNILSVSLTLMQNKGMSSVLTFLLKLVVNFLDLLALIIIPLFHDQQSKWSAWSVLSYTFFETESTQYSSVYFVFIYLFVALHVTMCHCSHLSHCRLKLKAWRWLCDVVQWMTKKLQLEMSGLLTDFSILNLKIYDI